MGSTDRAGSKPDLSYIPLALRLRVFMSSLVRRNWRISKSLAPFELIVRNLFDVFVKSSLSSFKNYRILITQIGKTKQEAIPTKNKPKMRLIKPHNR